ncbi:PucR family transcriptional regulator [Ornithinimicrobium cavernae]|uniref:PucR family transcriptional regulator n=1 Tax=Ornithinimicrobium cavernae TaxID=2666047 RepID=UPI000D69A994|nr:helix-turn-helix domain-containing protein [Ornithinimicrobium cavernae]
MDRDPTADREPALRNVGAVATLAAQRMDREHQWYRELSAEDRSWVGLVAQAGIHAFLTWYRQDDDSLPVTADIFGTAPRELAHTITLRQTLDLVRTTIDAVEAHVELLARPGEEARVRDSLLRYSREVAFAAAQIYASAAESRGAWDARLESLVVQAVVRGEADDTLHSRAAELGWEQVPDVAVVVGTTPQRTSAEAAEAIRSAAARNGLEVLIAVQRNRLIVVLGRLADPLAGAATLVGQFGPGPVVVGPRVPHLFAAGRSARSALSALDAAAAWVDAPRPVAADDLLAERALNGDGPARRLLVDRVYRPLVEQTGLLETATAYLDSGGRLEATGRDLFIHPNTVRYRLGRIAEVIDLDLTRPREAWVVRVALAYGRIADGAQVAWRRRPGRD